MLSMDVLLYIKRLAASGDMLAQAVLDAGGNGLESEVSILNAAAKGTVNIAAALASNAAGAFVIAASPDVPRNLRVIMAASWDGGDVTVNGTDQFNNPISEVFTTGSGVTRVGTKIFKTVTSATKASVGATANAATIGTGDLLGFVVASSLVSPVVQLVSRASDGVDYASEAYTLSLAVSGFTPTNVPDGARDYVAIVRS